ncbi:OmpA family protein [Candidatus Sumerlaeota bacterium]|nr:OmpA family protein [Candidatus Sumerlaeota bacterium]
MAKKPKEEIVVREIDPNAWMITFSDLLTLLLTFFVLLLTMSSMDQQQIDEAFGMMMREPSVSELGGRAFVENETVIPAISEPPALGGDEESPITTESEAYQELLKLLEVIQGNEDLIEITRTPEGIIVRFRSDLAFGRNDAELTSEAQQMLISLCPLLRRMHFPMRIEGHASGAPDQGGDPQAQMSLSLRRADSVLQHLIGLSPPLDERTLTLVGRGSQCPLRDEEGEVIDLADPRHRRVEIVIDTTLSDILFAPLAG